MNGLEEMNFHPSFVTAVPSLVLFLFSPLLGQAQADHPPESVNVDNLKAHAMAYDGKLIRVEGWLASGHLGVFLYDASRNSSVRLRSPDEVPSIDPKRVVADKLFRELWEISEHEVSGKRSTYHVELDGTVRVLKPGGKPAKEFDVFGQFPIELIPLHVLAIATR